MTLRAWLLGPRAATVPGRQLLLFLQHVCLACPSRGNMKKRQNPIGLGFLENVPFISCASLRLPEMPRPAGWDTSSKLHVLCSDKLHKTVLCTVMLETVPNGADVGNAQPHWTPRETQAALSICTPRFWYPVHKLSRPSTPRPSNTGWLRRPCLSLPYEADWERAAERHGLREPETPHSLVSEEAGANRRGGRIAFPPASPPKGTRKIDGRSDQMSL